MAVKQNKDRVCSRGYYLPTQTDEASKLSFIFASDYDYDGIAYVDHQHSYVDSLTRELNQYLGIKAATFDKPLEALDKALEALKKKYLNITVYYDKYQFEDWLLGEFDPETDVLK